MEGTAKAPDGVAIHYESRGTGSPAIVFVHGWSCDRTYWQPQMDGFESSRQVVSIDLAGHGESGRARGSWTMASFGEDVVAVVNDLSLRDVIMVGHSMGGDVIVEAAHLLGDRVRGLVWVDTYSRLEEPRTAQQRAAIVDPLRSDFSARCARMVRGMFSADAHPELVDFVATDMSAAPPEVAIGSIEQALGNDALIVSRLAGVNVPIFAINGDYFPTDVASLERHGVKPMILSGLGHFVMMEAPARFNAALEEVVQGLSARGG